MDSLQFSEDFQQAPSTWVLLVHPILRHEVIEIVTAWKPRTVYEFLCSKKKEPLTIERFAGRSSFNDVQIKANLMPQYLDISDTTLRLDARYWLNLIIGEYKIHHLFPIKFDGIDVWTCAYNYFEKV